MMYTIKDRGPPGGSRFTLRDPKYNLMYGRTLKDWSFRCGQWSNPFSTVKRYSGDDSSSVGAVGLLFRMHRYLHDSFLLENHFRTGIPCSSGALGLGSIISDKHFTTNPTSTFVIVKSIYTLPPTTLQLRSFFPRHKSNCKSSKRPTDE